MIESISETNGANYYGFESIDSAGKHHYHFFDLKGSGNLLLPESGLSFNP